MKENKVAELLMKLRKEHGFTQSDLADKLEVSFQAVSKWERAENLPDAFTLVKLAKVYEITVDEILNGEVKESKKKKRISRRLQNILMTIGIALIMISPIPYFSVLPGDESNGNIIAMLISVVIGVTIIVFVALEMNHGMRRTPLSKEAERINGIIYGTCVVIFLGTGLIWGLWHIAWIVFIIGYVVTLIFKK